MRATGLRAHRRLRGVRVALAAARCIAAALPVHAAMPWPVSGLPQLVKAYTPAVVHIGVERASAPARSSLGTGFIVSDDGLI